MPNKKKTKKTPVRKVSSTTKKKKVTKESKDKKPLATLSPEELHDYLQNIGLSDMYLRTYKLTVLARARLRDSIRAKYKLPDEFVVNNKTGEIWAKTS